MNCTVDQAKQWMADALADGWLNTTGHASGTYRILHRGAWTAHVDTGAIALDLQGVTHWKDIKRITVGNVTVWGPDELQVEVPVPYSFPILETNLRICQECGAYGPVVRLGFAGRVCPECRQRLADKVEFPGWAD